MEKKIDVFKIAEEIFANGRIKDPEDWDEMEIELDYVLSQEYGIEIGTPVYTAAMGLVKDRWHPQ